MKSVAILGSSMILAVVVGCGGATDSGGSVIMNGGGGAGGTGTAGTGFVPLGSGGGGTAGVGGTATAGHGGTSDGTGGTLSFGGTFSSGGTFNSGGGSGGNGGQPPAGTPGYPMGKVALCFGPGCPLGECDDSMFFSDTPCASVYTSDVGPTSTYCNAAETNTYCMQTNDTFTDYSVDCANGVATVLKCSGGCGNLGTGRWICQTF